MEEGQFGNMGVSGMMTIRIDLREIGCEIVDWFPLAQVRDQWTWQLTF
jgi:hypothetical protein